MKKIIPALCAALAFVGPGVASATVTSDSFQVKVKVVGDCVVTTGADMDFGTYDGTADLTDATSFTVTCANTTSNVGITLGSTNNWKMKDASGDLLDYSVWTDSAHSAAWSDVTNATINSGTPFNQNLYGLLALGQTANPGDYSDTVTITVSY
jgi:spore coat protein U-like protein